jgi:hypothetical protein
LGFVSPSESASRQGCCLEKYRRADWKSDRSRQRITAAPIKEEGPMRRCLVVLLLFWLNLKASPAQMKAEPSPLNSSCRIETTNYKGWGAEQLSNHWLQLVVVPQNGGRLMQVIFAGHPYLFVNPKYEGKYLPPDPSHWFNYGGDKLWLLPEGNDDEQHWVGNSDLLDDGPYGFRKVSEGHECEIELTGPSDPQTGIQIRRTIHLDADSPRIRFHATMQNKTGHVIEWSMQSVSQYDTAGHSASARSNRNFWTFTPANPTSSYLNRYHVRFGPAENPAVSVRDDGLFALHYVHLAAELWLDSTPGWLAVVDGDSLYAMVERFRYEKNEAYPGKASVIFWTNGPEMRLNSEGEPSLTTGGDGVPYYLEAEINSPLVQLRPGETHDLDTEWFPTRAGGEFHGVADAGIVVRPLQATRLATGHIRLSASFGVFFAGRLVAHLYDEHGAGAGTMPLTQVDPADLVVLETEVTPPAKSSRISLHLEDASGLDRGSLQEVKIDEVQAGAAENH